mgnify:FL=1
MEVHHAGFSEEDSLYVSNIIPLYGREVVGATSSGDYTVANEYLQSMHQFQRKYGTAVMPTERKVEL